MPRKAAKTEEQQAQASGDVYTMAEAARLKGVSYHTVSRAVRRGKLPAQRLGRMALISAEDLRDWRPMRERAPKKYRRREPNPAAAPALLDLASGERVALASRLAILSEVVHGSAADLPLPEFLALVADRLAAVVGLRRVAVWGMQTGGRVRRLASFGPPLSTVPADSPAPTDGPLADVLLGSEAVVVEDMPALLAAAGDDLIDVGPMFVAPMRVGSRPVGFVVGDANGDPFSLAADQKVLAEGLASQAALAVERAATAAEGSRRAGILDAVVEYVGQPIVASDAEGNLVLANAAARDLFALGAAEPSPDRPLDLASSAATNRDFDGTEIPLADTPLYRAVRGEQVRDRDYLVVRPDGGEQAVRVNARPLIGADGEPIGAVAVAAAIERPAGGAAASAREQARSRA
jgi:excisionase family DNA binding protein